MKWGWYFGEKNDDLRQNLFLEVKKPEIKETKGTFIPPAFKSSYWGPFSGLKSQDLIKISRTFPYGLFCLRSFCEISNLDLSYVGTAKSTVEISQNFVAFSEYMYFKKQAHWSQPFPRKIFNKVILQEPFAICLLTTTICVDWLCNY